MLEIDSVDWHLLENAKAHHTDKYEVVHEESIPVLRRAQPFKLTITFKNRSFNEAIDRVRLFFIFGSNKVTPRLESAIENTTVSSSNKLNDSKEQWSLQLIGQENKSITLQARGPPTAPWGVWNLTVKCSLKTTPKTTVWKSTKDFYLIYNPWANDDEVFMPDTRYLDEYILNDVGKVYTSSSTKPIGMKWIFGQFASPVIKVVKKILDEQELDDELVMSPVSLCHILAENIGSVIEGNWSGDYSGGTPPWLWTGSIPIFEEYLKTGDSVRYGQCFIYSGIFTTALRAVGIPARSVTNFVSATGGYNMALNYIFDKDGNNLRSASIWNFHVWNDAWMARYDLPPGYGGWQATDGTSGTGPSSHEAIKKGEICLQYEVRAVLAEVNADRVRWTRDENDEYHLINIDTKHVGRSLLTKQPFIYDPHGDTDFEDVMNCYKEPEGSKEERMAIYNAIKECKRENATDWWSPNTPYHIDIPTDDSDLLFEIEEIESILFGEPLLATVNIENSGEKVVTVEYCLGVSSMYYNGATADLIKRESKDITIKPKTKTSVSLIVTPEEYAAKLVEFTHVKIHCIATVKENKFTWANDYQLTMDMPEIIISSKDDLEVNKEGVLQFQFKNILKNKLTKCSLTYEAPGIGRNVKVTCKDIKAGEEVNIEHKVKPNKPGEIDIKAIFTSKELNFFSGSSFVQVL